jgi:hypothetical protein
MTGDTTLINFVRESSVDDNDTPLDPLDDVTTYTSPRIYQSTSIDGAPRIKPFIMYRQTSDVQRFRGDDGDLVRSSGFMIFVHDEPGDYLRIDSVIDRLKVLFQDITDQPNRIIRSTWVETSDDLRDDDMGTILRYGRVQVLYKEAS